MLYLTWMWISIGLFLAIQLFDHFWADRHEAALEQDEHPKTILSSEAPSDRALAIWLIAKLPLYVLILVLMTLKPDI